MRRVSPGSFLAVLLLVLMLSAACGSAGVRKIVIGSKNVSEQAILGELLAQQIERTTGLQVERKFYLGGTFICHNALVAGQIDLYPEYTGTAYVAILKEQPLKDPAEVYRRTRETYRSKFGIELTEPLGFNNTFAIMIRGEDARRLGIRTLSEASAYAPKWRAGFGSEFMEREDGLPGLAAAYQLTFAERPRIMDLGLTYRALAERQIDLIAGDSTNGLIRALDLFVLEDDKRYFPPYEAVPFVRLSTLESYPALRSALSSLGNTISDDRMRGINYAVDGEQKDMAAVVRQFLESLRGNGSPRR